MGSIFRKIQRCSVFQIVGQIYVASSFRKCFQDSCIAKIDRASSEMLVSKCDTRTEQIFHPRQFFVSRELARIPRGLVTSRSFARLIASLEILASSPFLFPLFRFFLETQIRVANFPPLCSVTAIKFGIQKCTIIFLTCEITYRRMDLTIARRTMRSESKTALSFLIAQFHRMSRSDPNYEFTSSHRPNSRGILRQSPFPLTPTSAFCIPKHSRILTRFCPIIIFSCYFFFLPRNENKEAFIYRIETSPHPQIAWKKNTTKIRFIEYFLFTFVRRIIGEDDWSRYKHRSMENIRNGNNSIPRNSFLYSSGNPPGFLSITVRERAVILLFSRQPVIKLYRSRRERVEKSLATRRIGIFMLITPRCAIS